MFSNQQSFTLAFDFSSWLITLVIFIWFCRSQSNGLSPVLGRPKSLILCTDQVGNPPSSRPRKGERRERRKEGWSSKETPVSSSRRWVSSPTRDSKGRLQALEFIWHNINGYNSKIVYWRKLITQNLSFCYWNGPLICVYALCYTIWDLSTLLSLPCMVSWIIHFLCQICLYFMQNWMNWNI